MPVIMSFVHGLPQCEGWLEKFSVGRSIFSRKRWQRRYVILRREGVQYMQEAPGPPSLASLFSPSARLSSMRCFVPFEARCGDSVGVRLRPVYFLRRVTPLMHPAVPDTCQGTSLCDVQSCSNLDDYYYFGLSFEEGVRRLFLLFRTSDRGDYITWSLTFSLYVSAGSISTIVPIPHPLREHSNSRNKLLYFKFRCILGQNNAAEDAIPSSLYVKDPNPCPEAEFNKIYKRVLEWDEGEIERLFNILNLITTSLEPTLSQEYSDEKLFKLVNITGELEGLCDDEKDITSVSVA